MQDKDNMGNFSENAEIIFSILKDDSKKIEDNWNLEDFRIVSVDISDDDEIYSDERSSTIIAIDFERELFNKKIILKFIRVSKFEVKLDFLKNPFASQLPGNGPLSLGLSDIYDWNLQEIGNKKKFEARTHSDLKIMIVFESLEIESYSEPEN